MTVKRIKAAFGDVDESSEESTDDGGDDHPAKSGGSRYA